MIIQTKNKSATHTHTHTHTHTNTHIHTHTHGLDRNDQSLNSLSLHIDPIAIDSLHFKLSFDTSYVVIGKLYHFHRSGSNPRII